MGIVKRQGIQSSILVYIGFALGALSILLLFPHFFSDEEFGLTRVLFSAAVTFAQIALVGVPTVMLKFFPFYRDHLSKKNDFLFLSLLASLGGFILVSAVTWIFHDDLLAFYNKKSPLLQEYFHLIYVFGFFLVIYSVFEAFARTHYKNVLPIFIRELGLRIYNIIIIFIYILGWINIHTFIYLFCIYYLFAIIIIVFYLWKNDLLHWNLKISKVSRRLKGKMITYGTFLYSGGLFSIIADNIDTFLIAGMVGLKSTAVYSVASYVATVIDIPKRTLGNVTVPVLSRSWKEKDIKNIHYLYRKTALNQLILAMLLFLLIWLNVDAFFKFLPASYSAGKYVILVIGIAKLIDLGCGINGEILVTSNFWRFTFLSHISMVALSIPTNYFLIKEFGIIGSAYSFLITYTIFNITRFIFIWWKFKLQPFSYHTLMVLGITFFTVAVLHFIPVIDNRYLSIVITSGLICILFVGPILLFRVSEDISLLVTQIMNRLGLGKYIKLRN